jgi:formylglycine-generating enzyme required for sulfatase activity
VPVHAALWSSGPDFVDPEAREFVRAHSPSELFFPGLMIADADGNFVALTHKDDDASATLAVLEQALASRPEWARLPRPPAPYDEDDPATREVLEIERRFPRAECTARAAFAPKLDAWLTRHPEASHPAGPLAHVLYGEALYNAGEFRAAESAFHEMLELYPDHPLRHRAYYQLLDRETWPVPEHPHLRGAPYPPPDSSPPTVPYPEARAAELRRLRADSRHRWSASGIPFVFVPPGTFTMGGSPPYHDNELPLRRVTLTRGFWLAAWPVTRAIAHELHPERWPVSEVPATRVSWGDALELIEFLSKQDGVQYRLPTEAEWEYAARGGLDGAPYPWGHEPIDPSRCNYDFRRPVPVACYPPNGYGLFDMVGNTFEWTADAYRPNAYSLAPEEVTDPKGPDPGDLPNLRVMRASGCGSPFAKVLARVSWRVGFDGERRDGATSLRLCFV